MANQVKDKTGKLPIGDILLDFFEVIEGIALVWQFGAKKYNDTRDPRYKEGNWKTIESGEQDIRNAIVRHLGAEMKTGYYDLESGIPHAFHIAMDALMYAWFVAKNMRSQGLNPFQNNNEIET